MLRDMLVRELMTREVITATPEMKIQDARQIMDDNQIRRLPVLRKGRLVGIITIGDIRHATPADETTLRIWKIYDIWSQITVDKVMVHRAIYVRAGASVLEAIQVMLSHKITGLPVLDETGALVGIITKKDVLRALVAENRMESVVAVY